MLAPRVVHVHRRLTVLASLLPGMDAMLQKLWANPGTAEGKQGATETAAALFQASTSTPGQRSTEVQTAAAGISLAAAVFSSILCQDQGPLRC